MRYAQASSAVGVVAALSDFIVAPRAQEAG